MKIGDIISNKRKELGLSIKELSKRCGISSTSLNKYEKHICLPTISNLSKISDALGLDYDEMYDILFKQKESRN